MSAPLTPEEKAAMYEAIDQARAGIKTPSVIGAEVWEAARAHYTPETERLRELITEIAIPCLRYGEEKCGHDDQARLNLEAGLRRAALAPDHSTGGEA